MNNSRGVSLVALVITIIVIIILASIVMNSSSDIISNALYAKFAQEFGDYSDQVNADAMKIKTQKSNSKYFINAAQMNYMVANGIVDPRDIHVFGFTTPVGYVLPDTLMKIYGYRNVANSNSIFDYLPFMSSKAYADVVNNYNGPSYNIAESYAMINGTIPLVGYVIDDSNIAGYDTKPNLRDGSAGYEFYGDSNGKEYHFVTSNGNVFTLPGFPESIDDGTIRFHVSNKNGCYYTVTGSSTLDVGALNVEGDIVNESRPITASDLAELGLWGMTFSGDNVSSYYYDTEVSSFGTEGRYTSIGEPTQWIDVGNGSSSSNNDKNFGWINKKNYDWTTSIGYNKITDIDTIENNDNENKD